MRPLLLYIWTVVFFYAFIPHLSAQNANIKLRAQILDFEDKYPLQNVLVSNKRDTVFTNKDGFFEIYAGFRDSITFQLVGYRTLRIPLRILRVKNEIFLQQKPSVKLEEVEVFGRSNDFYLLNQIDTLKTFYQNMPDTSTLRGDSRQFGGHLHRGTMVRLERDTTRPDGQIMVVIYGAVYEFASSFNKKEQERRKILDINYDNKFQSSFWRAMDDPTMMNEFMNRYGADSSRYFHYKSYFIKNNDELKVGVHSDEVKKEFYKQYVTYLRNRQ